jgi:hypothetical protein
VKIVNYQTYNGDENLNIEDYLQTKTKETKTILQTELLEKVMNWKFFTNSDTENLFCQKYFENSQSTEIYYNHELSKENFGKKFYFDRGLKYPKDKITNRIDSGKWDKFLYIPKIQKHKIETQITEYRIAKSLLNLPHGSQGMKVYEKKYKILWKYMNYDKFRFSGNQIMIDYNNVLISSDCKSEMLYLLAILNSKISSKLLNLYLHIENEQDLTVGIKSIKQYIRVPKITEKNKHIKELIIKQIEYLLIKVEGRTLDNLVNFKDMMIQRFDKVEVVGKNLVVTFNNTDYKLPIKEKADFVKNLIAEKYYDNGLIFNREGVTLQELKNLEAIDFDEQAKLKTEIDDLVFELYFGTENETFKNILA